MREKQFLACVILAGLLLTGCVNVEHVTERKKAGIDELGKEEKAAGYIFEELGKIPVVDLNMRLRILTRDADGRYFVWGCIVKKPGRQEIVGFAMDNGEMVTVDLLKYGYCNIPMVVGYDGNIYMYIGEKQGHFVKYDINSKKLIDLGVPTAKAIYWIHGCYGKDGYFYVGTYPEARLVRCDTKTNSIEDLGPMTDDNKVGYLINPVISDDNVVYCPLGMHHKELWAYDVKTRTKKQILPSELMSGRGSPKIWAGSDGNIWGQVGETKFLCKRDCIEIVEKIDFEPTEPQLSTGKRRAVRINEDGKLVLFDIEKGEYIELATQLKPWHLRIFCVGCEHKGKIYGGTIFPACLFSYDITTERIKNVGQITKGRIEIYDVLSHQRGLFLSSYLNCLDFYDPRRPIGEDNPTRIVNLGAEYDQERPIDLTWGPDGMVYVGTIPSKGVLGGALVRIAPEDLSFKVWRDIIENQSIIYLTAVPETGELFGASNIRGGSSVTPSEKEAYVFLWDTKAEKVVFRAQPIDGTTRYGGVCRARNGLVYGTGRDKFYVFSPRKREFEFVGRLPFEARECRWLSEYPVGPKGLIYGVQSDALFAIDPADNSVKVVARHQTLRKNDYGVRWAFMTQDGALYYGAEENLMRCRPVK